MGAEKDRIKEQVLQEKATSKHDHPGDICGNQIGVDGLGSCLLTGFVNPSGALVVKLGIPEYTIPQETSVNCPCKQNKAVVSKSSSTDTE